MTSMYRGRERFTREQLVFVVEAALAGALDKVDGAMPQSKSDIPYFEKQSDAEKHGLLQFQWGAVNQVGIFVPILWAQLNGDGMGTNDFYGWSEFEQMVEDFIQAKKADPSIFHPDCRALAEKIVDENFQEYLTEQPESEGNPVVTFVERVVATVTEFDSEGDQVDQYDETYEEGEELELDPVNQWDTAVGGDYHLVTLRPDYPNNQLVTVPIWVLDQDFRREYQLPPAIKGTIRSDDGNESADFDALPWFQRASDAELVALARKDYGGDYEADEVARNTEDEGIARVLDYCAHDDDGNRITDPVGFEVHIDEEAARAWIDEYRPHLGARIDAE